MGDGRDLTSIGRRNGHWGSFTGWACSESSITGKGSHMNLPVCTVLSSGGCVPRRPPLLAFPQGHDIPQTPVTGYLVVDRLKP